MPTTETNAATPTETKIAADAGSHAELAEKGTPPVLTYEQFRKLYKATRIYQAYDHNARANHAASHRLGYLKRQATGEFYYTHDLCPGLAFDTAQRATQRAYDNYLASVKGKAELLAALERIHTFACYASEENTNARAEMLIQIGLTAREAINSVAR